MLRPLAIFVLAIALGDVAAAAERPAVLSRLGSTRFRQSSPILALEYSPDGKYLASADGDSIVIWDATDCRRVRSIPVESQIHALRYSPDGRTLFAAEFHEGAIRLRRIDPSTGKMRSNSPVRAGKANVAFSPDASYLAVLPIGEGTIHVVNLALGTDWAERAGEQSLGSVAFRPDGKVLAVGTREGGVKQYDARTGRLLHEHNVDGFASEMAFTPDGKDLIAVLDASGLNCLTRFDATNWKARWWYVTRQAYALHLTTDGRSVIYRGWDAAGKYPDQWHWLDAATGKLTGIVLDSGPTNTSPFIIPYPVAWRSDGGAVALGGHDGLIAEWDLKTRQRLPASADPPTSVSDLHLTSSGTKVRGWSRGWYEWDLKTGKQTRLTPDLGLAPSERFAISFDLKYLAKPAAGKPTTIEIIDVATRERRHTLSDMPEWVQPYFLRDGRLAIASADNLTLYDAASGVRQVRIESPAQNLGNYHTFQIDPHGHSVGFVAQDRQQLHVIRWDLETGKEISRWAGQVPGLSPVQGEVNLDTTLSPNGRVVAVRYAKHVAPNVIQGHGVLLDTVTGRTLGEWAMDDPDGSTFSPDGRSLLLYNRQRFSYWLREVATGGHRTQVLFDQRVTSFTFGRAARTLLVATQPHPVEVWDAIGDAGPWEPKNADRLWDALAHTDAEPAYAAIRILLAHPPEAAAFLKARVIVPQPLAADWLAERLKALEAPAFRDREKATAELAAAGELAMTSLRAALRSASAEAGARIQGVLSKADVQTPEKLRAIRVCEVAEGLGTAEGQSLLDSWAKADPGTTLVREARESVERLKKR